MSTIKKLIEEKIDKSIHEINDNKIDTTIENIIKHKLHRKIDDKIKPIFSCKGTCSYCIHHKCLDI
jgi:hypothetical protein